MRLIKITIITAGFIGLAACSPSESNVEAAVKSHWPNEQALARDEAAFYDDQAEAFSSGAAMSARVDARLGVKSNMAQEHDKVAESAKLKANTAAWISKSTVIDVSNVRCEKASNISGYNCEMDIALKGADGSAETIGAGWRFDTINGRLAVVGSIAQ